MMPLGAPEPAGRQQLYDISFPHTWGSNSMAQCRAFRGRRSSDRET